MRYWNYDNLADSYDETRRVPNELTCFFKEEIHNFIESNFDSPHTLLSIGLGTGRVESLLSSEKHQLFGVDIAREMLKKLNAKNINPPCYPIQADGFSLPFSKSFQAILLVQIIHLIPLIGEFITELQNYSDIIIVGDAYTETHNHPIYVKFLDILLENSKNNLEKDQPINLKFADIIGQLGAKSTNKTIRIDSSIPNSEIYNGIVKRSFRSMWEVKEETFKKSLEQLELFIKENGINLDDKFKTKSTVNLDFYEFD